MKIHLRDGAYCHCANSQSAYAVCNHLSVPEIGVAAGAAFVCKCLAICNMPMQYVQLFEKDKKQKREEVSIDLHHAAEWSVHLHVTHMGQRHLCGCGLSDRSSGCLPAG